MLVIRFFFASPFFKLKCLADYYFLNNFLIKNFIKLRFHPLDQMRAICRWAQEYEHDVVRMYGGAQPYIMITNPKAMEVNNWKSDMIINKCSNSNCDLFLFFFFFWFQQVLSSNVLTYKYDPYRFFYPWLGQGLLTSNGKHWLNHRKMITPSFHFSILQDFLKIMNETTDRFMDLLDGYANKKEMFDFQEIVTRSTIDVICGLMSSKHILRIF